MRTLRAFRNMLLTALRNPVWAILTILVSPIRAAKFLAGVALLAFFAGFLFIVLADGAATLLGFRAGTPMYTMFELLAVVPLGIIVFRLLTGPMLLHFGEVQDATRRYAIERAG